jgi:hypothetical protein
VKIIHQSSIKKVAKLWRLIGCRSALFRLRIAALICGMKAPAMAMSSASFQISEATRPARWSALGWGALFVAALVGNLVLAIFAWFLVQWTMTLLGVG